nr:HAMP domain-containing sensor histidine kinase [Granulosicoccaceae sp. 1_MG-2023]
MLRINTIQKLTFVGLALVALPLGAGLIISVMQFGKLSDELRDNLARSTAAMETSRLIVSQTLEMERTAGQFMVLGDTELLIRYDSQRHQLQQSMTALRAYPVSHATLNALAELGRQERQLWQSLKDHTAGPADDPLSLPDLSSVIAGLPGQISAMVSSLAREMDSHINRVKHYLFYSALALIPLAALVAGFFVIRLTRPLQALGRAIGQLARGDRDTAVNIDGPQDTRELGRQLDALRCRLAEIDAQKLVFLQHVSHELKTPLTAIREGTALLQEGFAGALNGQQKEITAIIDSSSQQLQKEVSALLDFNHAINTSAPDYYIPVPLHELVDSVIQRHRAALQRHHIVLQSALEEVTVPGDERQLTSIADNLIANAIRYTPEGETLRVSLRKAPQQAVLDVIDAGPGIPPDEQARVFEPFVQGKNSGQSVISGTGLGLAIVARYTDLHGGSVSILPAAKGTHIQVTLPLCMQGSKT